MFDVFLSCSYRPVDSAVVTLIRSLCSGLRLQCRNLNLASTRLPPNKAKELISESIGLIAVVTRRDAMMNGGFSMPPAVHDEISIAFGLNKPALLLIENDIRLDGFLPNYGTHITFDRTKLTTPEVLSVLVGSLYDFIEECAPFFVKAATADRTKHEYYSELTTSLISLEHQHDPLWTSVLTKRLRFDERMTREIITGSWAGVPLPVTPGAPDMEWSVIVNRGSKQFVPHTSAQFVTPAQVRLACHIEPPPEAGDFLEISRICRSKYLNVLYRSQLGSVVPDVEINGKEYFAHCGFIPVESTSRLRLQFRAPRWYGVSPDDFAPFVASHATTVEDLVQSEMRRITSRVDSFGGDVVVDIDVEHPLRRHIYGVAWVPPLTGPC